MQRRLLLPLMGFIFLIVISCKENFKTLPLTETLVRYTQKDSSKKLNLIGVKETGTGTVVVKASDYQKITADENFIICTKQVQDFKQIWVYLLNGEFIGWFDTFNHFSEPGDYYLGTNYNQSYYYFPKTKTMLRSSSLYSGINYLLIKESNGWNIFTFDGELLLKLPQDAKVLHNLTSDGKEHFYQVVETKETVSLFDVKEKTTNVYPLKEWQKKAAQFKETKDFSHLTVIETANFF